MKLNRTDKPIPEYITQNAQILEHLKRSRSITGIEALHLFRTRDLPKRISELRATGLDIHSEWCVDSKGSRYKKYWLVSAKPKGGST